MLVGNRHYVLIGSGSIPERLDVLDLVDDVEVVEPGRNWQGIPRNPFNVARRLSETCPSMCSAHPDQSTTC